MIEDGLAEKPWRIWYAVNVVVSNYYQRRSHEEESSCPTTRCKINKFQNHQEFENSACQDKDWSKPSSSRNCKRNWWETKGDIRFGIQTQSTMDTSKTYRECARYKLFDVIHWRCIHLFPVSGWRWGSFFYILHIFGIYQSVVRHSSLTQNEVRVFHGNQAIGISVLERPAWRCLTNNCHKNISFDPSLMAKILFQVKWHKIIQPRNQFVILGPGVYRGGFNTGYSIEKATNFAEFSWPVSGTFPQNRRNMRDHLCNSRFCGEDYLERSSYDYRVYQERKNVVQRGVSTIPETVRQSPVWFHSGDC